MGLGLPVPAVTIGLLIASNVFMTVAWYCHLKFKTAPLLTVIAVSWFIALFEYVLQVPANRIGHHDGSPCRPRTVPAGQMAQFKSSRAKPVVIEVETRQPRILREKTSMTKAT